MHYHSTESDEEPVAKQAKPKPAAAKKQAKKKKEPEDAKKEEGKKDARKEEEEAEIEWPEVTQETVNKYLMGSKKTIPLTSLAWDKDRKFGECRALKPWLAKQYFNRMKVDRPPKFVLRGPGLQQRCAPYTVVRARA